MAKSALGSIIGLIITFIVLIIVAVVGFVAYQIACDVADKTSKKMEKKNFAFSKDGLKVGVKDKSAEEVGDSTQRGLMKAWNASEWPSYRSKLGWGQSGTVKSPGTEQRKSYSRHNSAQ